MDVVTKTDSDTDKGFIKNRQFTNHANCTSGADCDTEEKSVEMLCIDDSCLEFKNFLAHHPISFSLASRHPS